MAYYSRKVISMRLNEQELLNIEGGVKYSILMTIGAIGVFLVGVIDGILRPLKCN
jgi:multidrug transporter EmrE-like cation transporter